MESATICSETSKPSLAFGFCILTRLLNAADFAALVLEQAVPAGVSTKYSAFSRAQIDFMPNKGHEIFSGEVSSP